VARQRSAAGLAKQRDWTRRHRALLARERATLFPEPAPDPDRQPREFAAWANKYAGEPSEELKKLLEELRDLPGVKYRRERDDETWSWIMSLLIAQRSGAPFDLRTCPLGANPSNPNAQPSKMLRYLMATVRNANAPRPKESVSSTAVERRLKALSRPDFACRLYDRIRSWRKRCAETEQD
jgi:hypothetical protein